MSSVDMSEVRGRLSEIANRDSAVSVTVRADDLRAILAQQHQGEPVTLPARKPEPTELSDVFVDAGNESWNACLDEIAKLGPLYIHADPTSPFEVLAEHCAKSAIAEGVKNYRGASYTISQDDGGSFELVVTVQRLSAKSPQEVNEELGREVERLRAELTEQGLMVASESRRALSAERERDEAIDKYQRDVRGLNNEGDPIGGDPAGGYENEVRRLRAELAGTIAESERRRNCCADLIEERDTLRAQLAEAQQKYTDELGKRLAVEVKSEAQLADAHALLKEVLIKTDRWILPDLYERIRLSLKAASAEPSAPKCKTCRDQGEVFVRKGDVHYGMQTEPEPVMAACPDCAEPSAPVEIDEQAEFMAWANKEYEVGADEELNLKNPSVRDNKIGWLARAALERKP